MLETIEKMKKKGNFRKESLARLGFGDEESPMTMMPLNENPDKFAQNICA